MTKWQVELPTKASNDPNHPGPGSLNKFFLPSRIFYV